MIAEALEYTKYRPIYVKSFLQTLFVLWGIFLRMRNGRKVYAKDWALVDVSLKDELFLCFWRHIVLRDLESTVLTCIELFSTIGDFMPELETLVAPTWALALGQMPWLLVFTPHFDKIWQRVLNTGVENRKSYRKSVIIFKFNSKLLITIKYLQFSC